MSTPTTPYTKTEYINTTATGQLLEAIWTLDDVKYSNSIGDHQSVVFCVKNSYVLNDRCMVSYMPYKRFCELLLSGKFDKLNRIFCNQLFTDLNRDWKRQLETEIKHTPSYWTYKTTKRAIQIERDFPSLAILDAVCDLTINPVVAESVDVVNQLKSHFKATSVTLGDITIDFDNLHNWITYYPKLDQISAVTSRPSTSKVTPDILSIFETYEGSSITDISAFINSNRLYVYSVFCNNPIPADIISTYVPHYYNNKCIDTGAGYKSNHGFGYTDDVIIPDIYTVSVLPKEEAHLSFLIAAIEDRTTFKLKSKCHNYGVKFDWKCISGVCLVIIITLVIILICISTNKPIVLFKEPDIVIR